MKYENSICPGCGEAFKEDDDVVVCPECGTPQHRQCYINHGGCVNTALHGQGFVWKDDRTPAEKQEQESFEKSDGEPILCPRCGKENPKGSTVCSHCGQKFTVFGFNVVEKQQQLEREDEQERQQRRQSGFDGFSDTDEIPPIEQVVEERVKLLAPGISDRQKQEILCGHTIDKVISFVGYGAQTYVNKFRKLRDGKKFTFNWASFFLAPFWFFFRKLYKPGIIVATLTIILSLVMTVPMNKLAAVIGDYGMSEILALPAEQQQFIISQIMKIMPVIMLLNFISFAVALICGFISDRLYYGYTRSSLDEIDEAADNTFKLGLLAKYGSTSRWAPVIALGVIWLLPNLILMLFGS